VPDNPELIELAAVQAAAERLRDVAVRTPIEESRVLSRLAGVPVLLKCEHLQRTGSFKIRGAYNRIVQLDEQQRARGVACASAGNHAQGVALSAQLLGVRATVFMPRGAPIPKIEATRGYGAQVILEGDTFDDAAAACSAWADEHGAELVHPFEHPDIIAGQGTVGLEILEQVPDVATVVIAVGGGGLAAGVATAVKALRPTVSIIGVQAANVDPMVRRYAGEADHHDGMTIADGIAVRDPGELTLAHLRRHVDGMVTVSDEAIARAVLLLAERAKQVVEPSGAVPVAALLDGRIGMPQGPVVLLLGGGNVDPLLLLRILRAGMGEEGRTWAFRTRLTDQPGALSGLLGLIAREGANVVAVEHHRFGSRFQLDEVEVYLELETRGSDHIATLSAALERDGYTIE